MSQIMIYTKQLVFLAIWIFSVLNTTVAAGADVNGPDLVLVVSRHGVVAPKDQKYDTSWGSSYGQLTKAGTRQQYLLGAALAAKYGGKALQNYSHSSIYLQAHGLTFTLQSIYAQSLGLFPPGSGPVLNNGTPAINNLIQPLPVHNLDVDNDTLLYSAHSSVCPVQTYLQRSGSDSNAREVLMLIKPTIDKLKEVYNSTFTLEDVADVYEVLSANYLENKTFPAELSFIKYNNQYWKNISFAYNWWMIYKDFSTPDQQMLYSTNLLHDISSKFNNFMSSDKAATPTFISYVGHYSTLAAVLTIFNITTQDCLKTVFLGDQSVNRTCYGPNFASSIRFELYMQTNASDSYLKMYYDDNQINLCANNTTPCTVEVFQQTVETITSSMQLIDYVQVCYALLVPQFDEGKSLKIILWIILAINLLLSMCLIFVFNLTKKKKKSRLLGESPPKSQKSNNIII